MTQVIQSANTVEVMKRLAALLRIHRLAKPEAEAALGDELRDACADATVDPRQPLELAKALAVLRANPERLEDATRMVLRAAILRRWGRFAEARALFAQLELSAIAAEHSFDAGIAFLEASDLAAAERWMRRAVAAEPGIARFRDGLAAALQAKGDLADALATYADSLAIDPHGFDARMGSGSCELDRSNPVAADRHFRAALAIQDGSRGCSYLGTALHRQGRDDEAIAAYQRAVQMERDKGVPGSSALDLAGTLRDLGRFAEALTVLAQNIAVVQSADAQLLYGHLLLANGRFAEGWHHDEFRLVTGDFLARASPRDKPRWNGQNIVGKTILLRAEQGLGDTLQFVRYAPHVKALGAKVLLAVPSPLRELARSFEGIDDVVVIGETEATLRYDYFIPLPSLPKVFGTVGDSIPANVPYIRPAAGRIAALPMLFAQSPELKVGLVWAGSPLHPGDKSRSAPLEIFAPLGDVVGVRFFSLQKGLAKEAIKFSPAGLDVHDIDAHLDDLADTAAVVSSLDLVITVDTAVAHLAGALGKPVWILLAKANDWRWLAAGDTSAWYPSARLFRQSVVGDWTDVVLAVRDALEQRRHLNDMSDVRSRAKFSAALPVSRRLQADVVSGAPALAHTRIGRIEYVSDDSAEARSLNVYGQWLQPHAETVRSILRPGDWVLECNAASGYHTICASTAVAPSGLVFAYEVNPQFSAALRRNLAYAGCANVTVMRNSLYQGAASANGSETSAAEETIDQMDLDRLDLLKINDRADPEVILHGAEATLWRLRPTLLICARDFDHWHRIADLTSTFGYRNWHRKTMLFDAANFNLEPRDRFDGGWVDALLAIPEEIDRSPGAGWMAVA